MSDKTENIEIDDVEIVEETNNQDDNEAVEAVVVDENGNSAQDEEHEDHNEGEEEFNGATFSEEEMADIQKEVDGIDYSNYTIENSFSKKDEVNSAADDITSRINSGTTVKESGADKLLGEIMDDIRAMGESLSFGGESSGIKGMFGDFMAKFGFNKIKEGIEDIVDQNSTVDDMKERVFSKFDKQVEKLKEDVDDRMKLYESMVIQVKNLTKERLAVENKIKYINELPKTDKNYRRETLSLKRWMEHSNNLASLIHQGREDLDTIKLQLDHSIALEAGWTQMRPDLKRNIETQLSLSIKNQENLALTEAMGLIRNFNSKMSLKNLKEAGDISVKMIEEQSKPLYSKDDIKNMKQIKMENVKNVKKALNESTKNVLEYRGNVEEMLKLQDKTNYKSLSYDDSVQIEKALKKETSPKETKKPSDPVKENKNRKK
jgi:hypothetical protein